MTLLRDTVAEMREARATYQDALSKVRTSAPELLRELRKGHKLTQKDLAEILEIDDSYLSKIEMGQVPISEAVLERLYDLFYESATWDKVALDMRVKRTMFQLVKALDELFDEIPSPETTEEIDIFLRDAGYDPERIAAQMRTVFETAMKSV